MPAPLGGNSSPLLCEKGLQAPGQEPRAVIGRPLRTISSSMRRRLAESSEAAVRTTGLTARAAATQAASRWDSAAWPS